MVPHMTKFKTQKHLDLLPSVIFEFLNAGARVPKHIDHSWIRPYIFIPSVDSRGRFHLLRGSSQAQGVFDRRPLHGGRQKCPPYFGV